MFAYEAASATQRSVDFGDGPIVQADPSQACAYFDELMTRFQTETNADKVVIALSCKTRRYFRHDIWPDYKGNRKNVVPPESLSTVKAHAESTYKTYRLPRLEADDVLGILATSDRTIKGEKVIVSTDKDMRQIPGLLWNPTKGYEKVTKEQGDWWHLYQTLVGDPTDNYPGCPRIGPVKATRHLNSPTRALWEEVVKLFDARGLFPEDALVQARVAKILQAENWDRKKQEPILWQPS